MTHTRTTALTAMLASAAGLCTHAAEPTVSYERVPSPAMSISDMSPDGRYLVGDVDINADLIPDGGYIWDRLTDTFTLLPTDATGASAVSDDGSVVLGDMPDPSSPDPQLGVTAGMWTDATGWFSLGYLPNALECPSRSAGYELSADGSVAVGLSWDGCSGRGVVWTQDFGMLELEPLANGANRASVVSADGTLAAGFAQGTFSRTPAIWNTTTLEGETIDPAGNTQGEFSGMSDDGTVLLGTVYMGGADGNYDAVRWTASGGLEVIGPGSILDGWASRAQDIAADGTVVGFDYLFGNRRAWIQPQGAGALQHLNAWASAQGADLLGDDLLVPTAISADGNIICGFGLTTSNFTGWVLTVTPPCLADIDGNGTLNIDDIDAFVIAFLAGDLAVDFDGNGTLNIDDIDAFVAAFLEGCGGPSND